MQTLKDPLCLERHLAKSPAGLSTRILARIVALCAAIHLNWQLGKPPRQLVWSAIYDVPRPRPRATSLRTRPAPIDDSGWRAWDRAGWRNNWLDRVERAKRSQSTEANPSVGAFALVDLDLGVASQENWSAILSSHRSAANLTWSRWQADGVDVEAEPSDPNRNRRSAALLEGTARLARPIDDRYAFRAVEDAVNNCDVEPLERLTCPNRAGKPRRSSRSRRPRRYWTRSRPQPWTRSR